MTRLFIFRILPACLSVLMASASARSEAADTTRGALLYDTHCGACHTAQVHWRERRLVVDWDSLVHQVWRWQANANLDWSPAGIDAVARYLNGLYYGLPAPVVSRR